MTTKDQLADKNNGSSLENRIKTIAKIYDQRNLMTLEKADPPTYMSKVGGRWIVLPKANPFLDFVGCTKTPSRPLFIEAKSSSTPRLPFGGKTGITANQLGSMLRWQLAGAITGCIFEYRGNSALEFYWLDLFDLDKARGAGMKSIPIADMEWIGPGVGVMFDFWPIIRRRYLDSAR